MSQLVPSHGGQEATLMLEQLIVFVEELSSIRKRRRQCYCMGVNDEPGRLQREGVTLYERHETLLLEERQQ